MWILTISPRTLLCPGAMERIIRYSLDCTVHTNNIIRGREYG